MAFYNQVRKNNLFSNLMIKVNNLAIIVIFFTMIFAYYSNPIRVFLIGDSTMADKPIQDNPERGWGQMISNYFTEDVKFYNHAKNGRSTKSFINQGLWEIVLDSLSEGDYVFIQFGHNDAKKTDSLRFADPFGAYRNNLIKYIIEARSKGAIPVLITPVNRRNFDSTGKIIDSHLDYSRSMKQVAEEFNVPLLDLHKKSMLYFDSLGVEETKKIFLWLNPGEYKLYPEGKRDNTHFTIYGANEIAKLVVQCIKESNLVIKKYIK